MEEIILRFPVIAEQIFDQLDDQNVTKCRKICKTWYDVTERLQWIRKLQKLTKDHHISWKSVLVKIPTHFLKKLAVEYDLDPFPIGIPIRIFQSGWKWSPLHTAAHSGDLQLFEHIYEKSKDKNPQDKHGQTPFHAAAVHGSLEIFEFILERTEDKNPKNKYGWTTLHLAAEHGHLEICELIFENISSLNSRTDCGRTPLHEAAIEGHLEICKLLVLKVEDKNPSDEKGLTPLHAAAKKGYLEIYKFIAERVKEKNPEDRDGRTPLRLADDNGHYEICQLIYDYKIKQRDAILSNPEKKRRKKK